jgi:membrane associated rhomboid family serine protease
MEFINNDEDDNRGRNPLINNNNNIQENIINNNNNEEQNYNFILKYREFTISFTIIFIINLIIWITSFYSEIEKQKYVFEVVPIINHYQYYRFITRYFIHFGICHLLLELYITYYLCKYFENTFGSLFTISFILFSMVIVSVVQLFMGSFICFIINLFEIVDNSIVYYEGGLTSVLFALNTYYNLFDHDSFEENNIFTFLSGKGKYSSFTMLLVLYFFTPNKTFVGNLSGILSGYFINGFFSFFLPKISWIIGFENLFNLNNDGYFYRYITSKNVLMKTILNQIEPNCLRDIDTDESKEKNDNIIHNNNNNNINMEDDLMHSCVEMYDFSNNNNENN